MAAHEVPQTMRALVIQSDKTAAVRKVPVPSINDNEILARVVALAQNPTDWKGITLRGTPEAIVGCDWSGYVVKVGKNVQNLAIGDFVAGFVQGCNWPDRGAFAEYTRTAADLAWKVPEGSISPEEAATMGCAFWTAVQALFHPKRLGLVEPPSKVREQEWVFIYGGSGSVGMFAIQLAHLAGYKVVTVASPRNFDMCLSLGADAVFNYNEPRAEVVKNIKEATDGSLLAAFDTIGSADVQTLIAETLAPSGRIVSILPITEQARALRNDVEWIYTIVYTAIGLEFALPGKTWPASEEDKAHMAQFLQKVPELVQSGKVKPNPTRLFGGGLDGINTGLKYMQEGKNSGEKIVYRLCD